MKKKYRKSSLIVGALLVYTTAVAIYFLLILDRENTMEHYFTIGFSYVIIYLLWLVLRRREKLTQEREDSINTNK